MSALGMVSSVMLGGALGAMLRFSSMKLLVQRFQLQSPLALWFVNVCGSAFSGGLLGVLFSTAFSHHEWFLSFLVVGFLGSYTSVSAFGLETFHFLDQHRWLSAFYYVAASTVGCFLGFAGGWFFSTLALAFIR